MPLVNQHVNGRIFSNQCSNMNEQHATIIAGNALAVVTNLCFPSFVEIFSTRKKQTKNKNVDYDMHFN